MIKLNEKFNLGSREVDFESLIGAITSSDQYPIGLGTTFLLLSDAAERTSACTDMPEEPNSCWNIMELVGSLFVGPATWAFGRPKGSLLYQMLFRLSLESGFTIKFSTFSRLFIRKLGLYSWICTGELL